MWLMALWEVPLSHRPMGLWEFSLWEGRDGNGFGGLRNEAKRTENNFGSALG